MPRIEVIYFKYVQQPLEDVVLEEVRRLNLDEPCEGFCSKLSHLLVLALNLDEGEVVHHMIVVFREGGHKGRYFEVSIMPQCKRKVIALREDRNTVRDNVRTPSHKFLEGT